MSTKVYVGGLPWSCNADDLKRVCSKFGDVDDAFIVMDKTAETPRSKGFGFVTFRDPNDALECQRSLHGSEYGGRILRVGAAHKETGGRGYGGNSGGGQSFHEYKDGYGSSAGYGNVNNYNQSSGYGAFGSAGHGAYRGTGYDFPGYTQNVNYSDSNYGSQYDQGNASHGNSGRGYNTHSSQYGGMRSGAGKYNYDGGAY